MSNVIYAEFCGKPVTLKIKPWLLTSLIGLIHDSNPGELGYPYKIEAEFVIDAKEFASIKRKNELGRLFGVDLSNEIYAINSNIPAHNPTVNYSKPARNNRKLLKLTYFLRDHERAAALGFEQHRFKNGYVSAKYGQRIDLLSRGVK